MPVITMPSVPVIGIPTGVKERGKRVDLRPTEFDLLIETKGYLVAWTRSSVCPCAPIATQSENPDPSCTLCSGLGYYYFGGQSQDLSSYTFDPIQQAIIDDAGAMVVRAVITNAQHMYNPMDKMGNWTKGNLKVTVRPENKLGYWDRLVLLDSEMAFSEVLEYSGMGDLDTRYLVTNVNQVRSVSTVYEMGVDYEVSDTGAISWYSGHAPAANTRLSVHYLCHPTFVVVDQPHILRTTSKKFKTPSPVTPTGEPASLPIQATIDYEFLPRGGS